MPETQQKLKVILFDDDSQDAQLARNFMRKEGFSDKFKVEIVPSDELGISIQGKPSYSWSGMQIWKGLGFLLEYQPGE
jgi:hypothetical protein